MKARTRQPATFVLDKRSSVMGKYKWTVIVSDQGIVATRDRDRRRVSISWEEMIGLAMFHGRDSARNGK